jgi:alpha-glucosidase (family GH31 glycosyl hydrolase)
LYGDDYDKAQSRDVYLPAGKWMDYDTGKIYDGGTTLRDFPLPAGKTPLFVGGSGIVIEKQDKTMVARLYPLGAVKEESYLLPGPEEQTVLDLSARDLHRAKVMDQTTHQAVSAEWVRFAYQFPVEPGHHYSITQK